MGVFSKSGGSTKCCDDVNMQSPPQGGGNPPIFGPKEHWTICFDSGGNSVANQDGPTLADQISQLFSNLDPDCQQSFADALSNKISNQVNTIIQNFMTNPLSKCPPGQCKDIDIGLLDTPNQNGTGSVKVCCKGGDLDTSGGDPTSGWVIGAVKNNPCG